MKLPRLRPLYLTREPELVRAQLSGRSPAPHERVALADDVSTDEMLPAWACYYYDERLAHYCLVGYRGNVVPPGAVAAGGFSALVGGKRFGCGSSRETAPFAQRTLGVRLVIAESFAPIYRQNCHNLGIFTSTDRTWLERIERGEALSIDALCSELDEQSAAVLAAGGLGPYGRARAAGRLLSPVPRTPARPMTMAEKILARNAVVGPGQTGVPALAPGDVLFVRADLRFSHDYTTAMIDAQMRAAFGDDVPVHDPASACVFRDHLPLLDRVMPESQRRLGLLDRATELAHIQSAFAARHALRQYGPGAALGEGICHNVILERLARPGDLVVGTDSHTCTAGALGCFAFGVGSTDMAAGFVTGDFRVRVPESVSIALSGTLRRFVSAKDVWLALLAREDVRQGLFSGRVLEFSGDGVASLSLDERATLANMAVEAGAFTAILPVDDAVLEGLARERGESSSELSARAVTPDPDATYAARIELALDAVEPMVALPSDPKNAMPVSHLATAVPGGVAIDIAYGGSCTGSKVADMDLYAAVLLPAVRRGARVAPGVSFYIQFGSDRVRHHAEARGYVSLFQAAGATLLEPACGACVGAGPGASERPEHVTVSAANRNYPGRSGPGRVYLASPAVVAASALLGRIAAPTSLLEEEELH